MKTKKTSLIAAFFLMLLSISTVKATSTVQVYPTPSHEKLVIKTEENGILRIVDENGIVVKETPLFKGSNELKISEMTASKYILQVKTGENSTVKRLTIR